MFQKLAIIFSIALLWGAELFAQENRHVLHLRAGTQTAWEKDLAYSPLVYQGSSMGLSLGYSATREKKIDEVYVNFSSIPFKNQYGAEMKGIHADILTYTFYPASWLPEELMIGWSNNNTLSLRDFEDAQNFSPRFDFHTSFGSAIRYQKAFGSKEQWQFTSQAHLQLIGFLFSASYVTSPPDPFLHEESTFKAFLQSIRLFQPLRQHDLGVLNQFSYRLSKGNEIGVGYRFYYTSVEHTHRAMRSGGHYFIQLNFLL
jgi:hypothetical protein